MKINYDNEVDVAYIEMSSNKPDGAIEASEGIILHTTSNNEIVGIEIIDASKKIPIKSLYCLEFEPASVGYSKQACQ